VEPFILLMKVDNDSQLKSVVMNTNLSQTYL